MTSRVSVAFDANALTWSPTWTDLDTTYPSLITSYQIDRGRQFELDRTDTGRATVQIMDRNGILDPTNASGPYYGKIQPLKQVRLSLKHPGTGAWHTRFRGWIEEYDYSFHPSQKVNQLTLSLVDIFEILAAVELLVTDPPTFGVAPPQWAAGNVFYENQTWQERITQIVVTDCHIPTEFVVVFTGNVELWETSIAPGESALAAVQEAADAEFPGVSNIYADRLGRLCAHGRLAKFDPVGVASGAAPGAWDWRRWKAGDHAAVTADVAGGTAQLRQFALNRGLAKIINNAVATPIAVLRSPTTSSPPTPAELAAQLYADATSQGLYGYRSWSADNLLTKAGFLGSTTALVETKRFAQYYVDNYKTPRNRITSIGFRSGQLGQHGATHLWDLLTQVDISDEVTVTVTSPGGGGISAEAYFVEGVHQTVEPLNAQMDNVTVSLDLSPRAYYDVDPWA